MKIVHVENSTLDTTIINYHLTNDRSRAFEIAYILLETFEK